MATPKEPRPYIDPYLAGALLGVVLFLSFFVTGGGLGASSALSHVQTGVLDLVAPLHNLGAWLFLAFFVLHTYLVTTGPTLGEHLRSMVTGFRSAPPDTNPQGA